MGERLFTEDEWRALAEVERMNEGDWTFRQLHPGKRVYGPSFSDGEYFLYYSLNPMWRAVSGPPKAEYRLVERTSETVVTWPCSERGRALSTARRRIALIGPEKWAEVLEDGRQKVAAREADRVILKAKTQKKPRKIGKRARAVFEASAGKCHYCETVLTLDGKWHIEHKMPRALFGGSEQSNLVAACAPCNMKKRDKTDLEFIAAQGA